MRMATSILAAVGALAMVAILVVLRPPRELMDLIILAVAGGWVASPYLVFHMLGEAYEESIPASLVVLVLCLLTTAGGLYLVVDALFVHPDPQSPVALVFIPAYQWAAAILTAPVAWLVGRLSSRLQATEPPDTP